MFHETATLRSCKCEVHDPIGFPTRTAVNGHRLFPPRGAASGVQPKKPCLDRTTTNAFLSEKRSGAFHKAADHGRFQAVWICG